MSSSNRTEGVEVVGMVEVLEVVGVVNTVEVPMFVLKVVGGTIVVPPCGNDHSLQNFLYEN